MMINPDAILSHDFGEQRQHYDARDAILYALGIGLGVDPCDPQQLAFLDERALSVLPSFAVTLGSPGMWMTRPEFGIDVVRLVHAEQRAWFEQPLPPVGDIMAEARVVSLSDRGEGKGAVLVLERQIRDSNSGATWCRLHQTLLLRGNGGFGGPAAPMQPSVIPDRPPEMLSSFATSPRAALIYRLSGDWNPLHLDPAIATKAGFAKPILHGLASYGIAGWVVSHAAKRDVTAISELGCRFSGIVLPGDTLDFHIWSQDPDAANFQAYVGDRKVIDQGVIRWRS
ncbi:MaoC/PaaZ C-terminal domain-containing protein [Aquisediminimonas sediminicola]|uniref:MaoC/PaaZ C-terminal domain-containing protein n=1 Tax=Alteraquisediminimonas sediminicola TaxID=2676787 RepID=UPI001C8D629F|nr:MaoC/PaaZ C-terminal domain-containing protein [Aquisediminimonas sediminicola]